MCNMCIVLLPLSLGNVIKCDCIIIIMALPPRVAPLHGCLLLCLPLHVAGECAMDQLIRPQTFRVVARHRHTLSVRGQQCRVGGACHVEWQPKFVVINHAIWQRAFGLMRSLFHSLTYSVSFSLQTPQLTATQQGPLCGAPRINKQEQEVEAKARAEEAGERRRRSRREAKADEVEAAVSE